MLQRARPPRRPATSVVSRPCAEPDPACGLALREVGVLLKRLAGLARGSNLCLEETLCPRKSDES